MSTDLTSVPTEELKLRWLQEWAKLVCAVYQNQKPLLHNTPEKVQHTYEQVKQHLINMGFALTLHDGAPPRQWNNNMPLAFVTVAEAVRAIDYCKPGTGPGEPRGERHLLFRQEGPVALLYYD